MIKDFKIDDAGHFEEDLIETHDVDTPTHDSDDAHNVDELE